MSGPKIQGFNTELAVGEHRYHIQTELVSGRIVTLIFENGAVVGGKKTELVGGSSTDNETMETLRSAMMEQHKLMIENIKKSMKQGDGEVSEKEKLQKDKDLIKKFLENWAGE
ncbi:MAG: hypothetical protein ACUVWP_09180 [bacterium]